MAKKFNFKPFEAIGSRGGRYAISLARHGAFGFNSGFYRQEGIRKYTYVKLSYDEGKKAVGFKFTKRKDGTGAWKISHGRSSGNVVVRSFFKAYGLEAADYTGKYEPKTYKDSKLGKLFYIILKKNKR